LIFLHKLLFKEQLCSFPSSSC